MASGSGAEKGVFSRLYLELTDTLPATLRENSGATPAAPGRTRESSVSRLWMKQPWAPHPLRDVKGRLVRILSPGWMRGGSGPDFAGSIFQLEGRPPEKGDVEIHVHATDWTRHRHHKDPAYDSVRLHVVLYCDVKSKPRLTLSGGEPVELALDEAYPAWRAALRLEEGALPAKPDNKPGLGGCARYFERIEEGKAADILDAAGEGRLILKSERLARDVREYSGETALYLGLMEALGYSSFSPMFRQLGQSLPLGFLRTMVDELDRRQRPVALEAALLGMAGLLPEMDAATDDETGQYLARTLEAWGRMKAEFRLDPIYRRADWKLSGSRPANYPMGRLAGMAAFLATNLGGSMETMFQRALSKLPRGGAAVEKQEWLAKLSGLFSPTVESYWATRHVVGGKRLSAPRALVSGDRVLLFMINMAIPFFISRATEIKDRKDEEELKAIAQALPRPAANAVTKYMVARLFGGKAPRGMLNAVRDQGLMQIYADFCHVDSGACHDCALAGYMEQLADMP